MTFPFISMWKVDLTYESQVKLLQILYSIYCIFQQTTHILSIMCLSIVFQYFGYIFVLFTYLNYDVVVSTSASQTRSSVRFQSVPGFICGVWTYSQFSKSFMLSLVKILNCLHVPCEWSAPSPGCARLTTKVNWTKLQLIHNPNEAKC